LRIKPDRFAYLIFSGKCLADYITCRQTPVKQHATLRNTIIPGKGITRFTNNNRA